VIRKKVAHAHTCWTENRFCSGRRLHAQNSVVTTEWGCHH
jgi:hypothetical protein